MKVAKALLRDGCSRSAAEFDSFSVQGGVDADEQPALLLGPTTAVVAAAAALLAAVVALLRAVVVALLIAVVELGHQPPRPVQLNEDSPKAPRTELSQRQYPTQFRIPMSVPE